MRRHAAVQHKVPCVFKTQIREESSKKRLCQSFQVVATEHLSSPALNADLQTALATEKLDGTCCYVSLYRGEPFLWARLDRKPNKQAEKRFRKFQRWQEGCSEFCWNVEEDFRSVPPSWIPALGVQYRNGQVLPDTNGHIPGWVPVEQGSRQHCWHECVLDRTSNTALILRPHAGDARTLEVCTVPLVELLEQTLELIGTNINGNPYGLGTKQCPIHLLVPHGAVSVPQPPTLNITHLKRWLEEEEGQMEGIVWHCGDGSLFKIHRHHLGLAWPVTKPVLNSRPVIVGARCWTGLQSRLCVAFSQLAGRVFDHIQDIQLCA